LPVEWNVNKWQALVRIVDSFNKHGSPQLAIVACVLIALVPSILWTALAAIKLLARP